jgi:hypothetical protein
VRRLKIFWLTPEQIIYALVIGVVVGVCISFASMPHPVEVPVQVITPVPTPAPVIITERPTPVPTPEITQDIPHTLDAQRIVCIYSGALGGNFYILFTLAVIFCMMILFSSGSVRSTGFVVVSLMTIFMIWIFNPFGAMSDTCNQGMAMIP